MTGNKKALKRGSVQYKNYTDKLRKAAEEDREIRAHSNQQMMTDALVLAVHEVYGFGGKRIIRLCGAISAKLNEISHMVCEDAADDKEIAYAKATLDKALQQAYGKAYKVKPFDERYLPEGWERR